MFDFSTLYIRPCSINILYIQIKLRFVYAFISTYINLKRKPKITTNKKQQCNSMKRKHIWKSQIRIVRLIWCSVRKSKRATWLLIRCTGVPSIQAFKSLNELVSVFDNSIYKSFVVFSNDSNDLIWTISWRSGRCGYRCIFHFQPNYQWIYYRRHELTAALPLEPNFSRNRKTI